MCQRGPSALAMARGSALRLLTSGGVAVWRQDTDASKPGNEDIHKIMLSSRAVFKQQLNILAKLNTTKVPLLYSLLVCGSGISQLPLR